MQMPTQTPFAPPPPTPPTMPPAPPRSYLGLRTGILMFGIVIVAVIVANLLPGSVVTARNLAYPQPNIHLSASTTQAHAGDTVQFTVQVLAGNDLTYSWSFGDSQDAAPVPGGPTMSHTYANYCNQCQVTVLAVDPIQHQAQASTTITVAPPAPTASFTYQSYGYDYYYSCYDVSFDASASQSGDNGNLSYAWNFGDGNSGSEGPQTTNCYTQTGNYTVTLTVTDDFGQSNQTTMTITAS